MAELEKRYGPGRRCPTGQAVITGAGRLPADWVIHAVGPVWRGGGQGEERLLERAYRSSLALATEAGARSVTLPAISCGIYGYPLADGARVALRTVADGLRDREGTVERATFVLFSTPTLDAFRRALDELRTETDPD
jgi:O-acetyl-ADP-ribose deacetylase (regulator of RNase III)